MRWTLTDSSGTTMNSGQTPFYTSYLNKDYSNARLYFHYTNYTFYSDYFYDITYTYYFDNKTNNHDFVYAMFVSSCYIYIEGIGGGNQYSDGCEILEQDQTHLKIRTRNLKIKGSGPVTLQLSSQNDYVNGNTDIMHVQMNSYLLEISAKTDTSISSSQFEDGISSINDNLNDLKDSLTNSDISDNDKHLPSKGSFEDFKEAEKNLTDKVKEADTSVLSIGIDSTSSSWVWDTLTSLIKSNTIIFGMFIAILSIGVIKLGLGR